MANKQTDDVGMWVKAEAALERATANSARPTDFDKCHTVDIDDGDWSPKCGTCVYAKRNMDEWPCTICWPSNSMYKPTQRVLVVEQITPDIGQLVADYVGDVFNTLCGDCGAKKSGSCGECKLARAKEMLLNT